MSLGTDDLRAFIAAKDAEFAALGGIDPATKERRRPPQDAAIGRSKLRVDDAFRTPQSVISVMLPAGMVDVRDLFDRPADVAVVGRSPEGAFVLCLTSHHATVMAAIKRRRAADDPAMPPKRRPN